MDPKSSGGETKDGSSSVTEPMETSTDVASSLRKGETKDSVEKGDREVDEDAEEEDSDTDWDKDSFDGREYYSSDHSEYSDEEFHQKCRNYNRAVIETKGFFEVSKDFPAILWSGIAAISNLDRPVENSITAREFLAKLTCECVDEYNKRNMKNLKFESVLRANFNPRAMTKYYITFAARESESSDAPLVEYQAKVVWYAGESYPIFCRPSPIPK